MTLDTVENWIQHNDIFYRPVTHGYILPNIPAINISQTAIDHLKIGSNPLETKENDGLYFMKYDEDRGYSLLEAKAGKLYPIKNNV